MGSLRKAVVRLAHKNPGLRKHLIPILRKTAGAKITGREFDALRPGKRLKLAISSTWSSGEVEFEVGRTTYSKKYDVYSKRLFPIGPDGDPQKNKAKWTLFKRLSGVSLAHGDMGVMIKSVKFL